MKDYGIHIKYMNTLHIIRNVQWKFKCNYFPLDLLKCFFSFCNKNDCFWISFSTSLFNLVCLAKCFISSTICAEEHTYSNTGKQKFTYTAWKSNLCAFWITRVPKDVQAKDIMKMLIFRFQNETTLYLAAMNKINFLRLSAWKRKRKGKTSFSPSLAAPPSSTRPLRR